MDLTVDECRGCGKPIIYSATVKGELFTMDADARVGGVYRLTARLGAPALAAKATPKLAFGTKLYIKHECQGRRWTGLTRNTLPRLR